MSTDRQRLQAAIQRIAKQDPDLSALIAASKNKGGQASSSGIGTSDAERDNLCCDGTEGAGANAGSDQRDPSEDGASALDSTDPANLDGMGQGSLTDITDCATGAPICFDGSDWVPPEGWNDATDPFTPELSGDPCSQLSSPDVDPDVQQYGYEGWFPDESGSGPLFRISVPSCSGHPPAPSGWTYPGIACGDTFQIDCPGGPFNTQLVLQRTTSDFSEPQKFENPFWPTDGCTNIAIQGGKIVGSQYDPENDGSYSAPRDEIEVCDADGDRILLRGSPTGGWKSIKSLSGDIDPDAGNGYLYRPNGQRVRQISPSEFRDDTV